MRTEKKKRMSFFFNNCELFSFAHFAVSITQNTVNRTTITTEYLIVCALMTNSQNIDKYYSVGIDKIIVRYNRK